MNNKLLFYVTINLLISFLKKPFNLHTVTVIYYLLRSFSITVIHYDDVLVLYKIRHSKDLFIL